MLLSEMYLLRTGDLVMLEESVTLSDATIEWRGVEVRHHAAVAWGDTLKLSKGTTGVVLFHSGAENVCIIVEGIIFFVHRSDISLLQCIAHAC